MAEFSTRPWGSIQESDYASAEDFCAAALVDSNKPGAPKAKGLCKLPVKEPRAQGGKTNVNGMRAAAAVLAGARGGVQLSPEDKRAAARKLLNLFLQAKVSPPASLREMVDGKQSSSTTGEMATDGPHDDIGLVGELVSVSDEANLDALVPLPQGVDLNALIDDDETRPRQVILEVRAGESRNNRVWSREALSQVASEINDGGLPGYKGHIPKEEIGHRFVDPATHWVGAREAEPGRFLFRGVVDKSQQDLKRWLRTGRVTQGSIFGKARGVMQAGKFLVKNFTPYSIDWTPLKRAGMPTGIVAMEMDEITNPGTEPADPKGGSNVAEEKTWTVGELLGELRRHKVQPSEVLGEMGWPDTAVISQLDLDIPNAAKAIDKPEWDKLEAARDLAGEMVKIFGEEDPAKIIEVAKGAKKALDDSNTSKKGSLVEEVVKDKVAGEMAQNLVKKLLRVEEGASKEDIEKEVGEIMGDDDVKALLKNAHVTTSPAPKQKSNDNDHQPVGARRVSRSI